MMRLPLLLLLFVTLTACGDTSDDTAGAVAEARPTEAAMQSADAGDLPPPEAPALNKKWTGDLDGMIARRVIRVLTVYGPPRYFLDDGRERGATFEVFREFENDLNEKLGKKHVRVHVVIIPVARDQLIPGLLEGRGDIAAAGLTVTGERQELVDFTEPFSKPLNEILVMGPSAPPVATIEDLAGTVITVRESSSYRSSLDALNQHFRQEGKPQIDLQYASEFLEDDDLLEMVNSGMLPWAVVDDYKADSWANVFKDLVPRRDIVFRQGGQLAYAIRKNSPQLRSTLNGFLRDHRQGTLLGNILINRYVRDFDWVENALATDDFGRFEHVVDIFRRYGEQYTVDYLLVTAQGYQESQLDNERRSAAGAVGIMQLLPSTAADPNVGIADISELDNNIHAGVKYLSFIRGRYFNDPGVDDLNGTLFSLASYNAGPARVNGLRKKAASEGYDPNKWFDNVEVIAAREIGRETVQYVANIVKYYLAYRLTIATELKRRDAQRDVGIGPES